MTDTANTRELVLGILLSVEREEAYSHLVIRSVLEKYQYLEKQERAFITRLAEGTIQRRIELDYIINRFSKVQTAKMKPVIRNLLRMSVFQMKYMDSVPDSAACNEAVVLAKKKGFGSLTGFVNGVLRNIARNLSDISYPDEKKSPVEALSVRYSMPEWIVRQWQEAYGTDRTKEMLHAFLQEAPLTVRTNLAKTTPKELKERFQKEGVTAEPLDETKYPGLSYAFALSSYDYLGALPSFREGLFYVQDISSMMVAELAAPKEGDSIIDVCAAPGGKSLHLAEKMRGTGCIEARDLTPDKTALIEENIQRCGAGNVVVRQWDATVRKDDSVETADLVIADLPCSGLGVLRKKSDIKYRMSEEQQAELAALQRKILDTVYCYVKHGGALIYSTCTINPQENEENVRWFLERHRDFLLEDMKQIFPGEHLGDGFFLARLNRR